MQSADPRIVIYWFSGTGNSLVVARGLAAEVGNAELRHVSMADEEGARLPDCVGVVFPVYAFGLPRAVADFLGRIKVGAQPYVFTVATMAMMPGGSHRQAEKMLASCGVALAAGWSVRMPENFSPLSSRSRPAASARRLEKARKRVREIARCVSERRRSPIEDSYPPMRWLGPLIHRVASPRFALWDRAFTVSHDCTSCGTCERVCPVGNITLEEGVPTWHGKCEQCAACMQWCPVEAIRAEGVLVNRRRYRHPEVSASDLFVHTVDDADTPPL